MSPGFALVSPSGFPSKVARAEAKAEVFLAEEAEMRVRGSRWLEGLQLAGASASRRGLCVVSVQKHGSDTQPHVGEFPTPAAEVLRFNSLPTLLTWTQHQSHRLRSQPHRTAPTSDPSSSPGCHLCFYPLCIDWRLQGPPTSTPD